MGRTDVTPGTAIGTYVVQGLLGATAWSDTFVATGADHRSFALKAIDAGDDAAWPEIERIAKQLESVPEHLVLAIAGIGHDEESAIRFIATPLSEHPSLADLVDIYALSPSEAIALVKNLGIALDGAHAAGLVHLALKPANVFVGPPPTYAVRLVDFGADALRRAKKERGDLAWLAPEQLETDEAADARADVFTAALLAFFTMTGKRYWPEDEERALVAPSERARALGADVPAKLDAVLLRALGPKEERHESVRAFAEGLESALAEPSAKSAAPVEEARSSERHIKATLKLDKFRMPTLENSAPSGTHPLPQKTLKMPAARFPDSPLPFPAPTPATPAPAALAAPASPTSTSSPIATPIEPEPARPRRTIYIPQRVLIALVVAVTALTLGVTVAAVRKIRNEALPTSPSASVVATPAPPAPIVVPPPPEPAPEQTADDVDVLGPNESELEVVCMPACEKVLVDGKYATQYPSPLRLPPGRHGIGVGKAGYGGQYKLVFLKPGERQTVEFKLGATKK